MTGHLISISEHFGVSADEFLKMNLLDSTINADVNLFIDPTLFENSAHSIFRVQAREKYKQFFIDLKQKALLIISLPHDKKDMAIRTVVNWICAKETAGVCLGYSLNSNNGSGVGPEAAEKILRSAISIFEQNIDDPMIFSILHLLEDGIGPDYISDLTSKIILEELCIFTSQMAQRLNIKVVEKVVIGKKTFLLPKHPLINGPIFLLPKDILNDLPTENNFRKIFGSYSNVQNDIKTRINEDIASIYGSLNEHKLSEVKEELREYIYKSPKAISEILSHFSSISKVSYDFSNDKLGINLASVFDSYVNSEAYKINRDKDKLTIINDLIKEFKVLIDNNNYIKRELLWTKNKHKPEKAWQSIFHLFVDRVLAKNDIDLSREFQTGSGPIDFKFSQGSSFRVLIEIKLSSNNNYIDGFTKQTEKYKKCTENTKRAYYIYFDVESDYQNSQKKVKKLHDKKTELGIDTEIIVIDGRINPSASNLKLFS